MIFPDWGEIPATAQKEAVLPLYTEWAVDWETNSFALRGGMPYTVTGIEALKLWVRCALHDQSRRFLYSAHSPDYGNEFAALLGACADQGIWESQLRRAISDALLISPYITAVDGFSFSKDDSRVTAQFTVHTVYDDFISQAEVITG